MALANIVVRTTGSGISTLASNVDAGIVKKGTPLTHIEVDTNFLEIADTVKHLPINNLSDVTITSASTGQVLKYNGSAWVNDTDAGGPADTDALSEGSSNLYFTNARARAAISEGSTQLAYNSGTGVLTFTQGDSDTVAEGSTNLYYTDARADARAQLKIDALVDSAPGTLDTLNELAAALGDDANFSTTVTNSIATKWTQDNTKISNWDTAYGWGNHASAGYLTSFTETNDLSSAVTWANIPDVNVPASAVTQHQSALSITESQISDLQSFSIHTADFNATSGSRHAIDTSSNTVTATLPGSPATGDAIFFADAGGNYATNKLTLGRNGNTIMGLTQDMDVTTNNQSVGVFYNGTTWRIY